MSDNILSNLESLSPDELAKVGNLIQKFSNRHEREDSPEVPKQRKNKKKHKKRVDNSENDLIVEHGPGRTQSRKRIVLPDEQEQPNEKRSTGVGRTQPRNPEKQGAVRGGRRGQTITPGRGQGRTLARTEPVQLSGENKFDTMKENKRSKKLIRDSEKSDTLIDKALWTDREASDRPDEFQFAEVQCVGPCGLWFDVNPGLILIDQDSGLPNFTCNNCGRSARGMG